MDPYGPPLTEPLTPQDRQLMNEVIFLHYLWQQGPPSTQFTPPSNHPYSNPNPNPFHQYPQFPHPQVHHHHFPHPHPLPHPHPHSLSRNLGASNLPSFKRTKKNKSKSKRNRNSNAQQRDPGPDWPVNSPPPSPTPSTSGWPSFNSNPDRKVSEPDNEKLAKIVAMHLQQNAANRLKEFLANDSDATDEEGEEDSDNEEGYFAGSVSDVEASEEYKFLLSVFVEDHELRELYERSLENGELICLACEAMGGKLGRTYKEAIGLARHALTITKKGRKTDDNPVIWTRCHRALGQVICRVYGWDVSRYPILLVTKEPLGVSLKNSGDAQVEVAH
ncbi:hypothetical protein LINGRAHAP2_LOCUS26376 [Linum grandiflorum]